MDLIPARKDKFKCFNLEGPTIDTFSNLLEYLIDKYSRTRQLETKTESIDRSFQCQLETNF